MAVAASCWRLIVEYCVIPPGQLKWVLLGYYINSVFLVFCQFYLFGRFLAKLLYYPVIACWYLAVALLRFLPILARKLVLIMELDDESIARLYGADCLQEDRRRWFDFSIPSGDCGDDDDDESFCRRIVLYECPWNPPPSPPPPLPPPPPPPTAKTSDSLVLFEQYEPDDDDDDDDDDDEEEEEEEEEEEVNDEDDDEPQDTMMDDREESAETDEFYEEYTKNMKAFDQRNNYGISTLSLLRNMDMRNLSLLERTGNEMYSIQDSVIREMTREYFDDLEMNYVGQTCLSWDVLLQQYRKVKTLAYGDIAGFFYGDIAGEFQKFQVFLERFTESSRLGGTRFLNYVHTRLSNNILLQVPNVPGFVEDEGDLRSDGVVRITAKDLLGVMKRSIETFKYFLDEDRSRSRSPGRFRRQLLSVDSPVENPNDLELFLALTKRVNKKEIELRNLQREKKGRTIGSWWKKKKKKKTEGEEDDVEEEDSEMTKELLIFNVIEIKLLSRVLKMSNISTQQLRWCQQKLQNLVQVRNGVMLTSSSSNDFFSFFPNS